MSGNGDTIRDNFAVLLVDVTLGVPPFFQGLPRGVVSYEVRSHPFIAIVAEGSMIE